MGHDIRVHRSFYRLPEHTLQTAKVTKLLHAINQGDISRFKGKDFDEIEFDHEGKWYIYIGLKGVLEYSSPSPFTRVLESKIRPRVLEYPTWHVSLATAQRLIETA